MMMNNDEIKNGGVGVVCVCDKNEPKRKYYRETKFAFSECHRGNDEGGLL